MTKNPIHILLAEDEDTDAFFLIQALEDIGVEIGVCHVKDGQEALDYLGREGKHKNAKRPNLILLDINMPRKSGYDVLKIIKADSSLKSIPVIIVSGSDDANDVKKSYDNQAAAFVTKSKCLESMSCLAEAVEAFWFKEAILPS